MTKHNNNNDAADPDDSSPSGAQDRRAPAIRGKDRRRRERTIIADEAAVLTREKSVTTREDIAHSREDAAGLREGAAHLREGATTLRERAVRAAEMLCADSGNHMVMLQQVNAALVIATIEAQKLAEQVRTATIQLESAKLIAEKANLAKSDFLSRMSHELRTPLNAILGFAQLMEASSPPPTPTQTIRLQHIIHSGWYLLDLINEVLDLAAIEAGKLSVLREQVMLSELMLECQAMVEPEVQKHNIQINFLPVDECWAMDADRTRVKQALLNLLSNAIKYNHKQGTVEAKCTSTPERIRISVRDSGIGLSAERQAQLFQPFNRLGQADGGQQGTGIGLIVTKQLIELMGGTIGMESTEGAGSEFWIELPRYVMSDNSLGNSPGNPPDNSPGNSIAQ